jgi:hypothetical protein
VSILSRRFAHGERKTPAVDFQSAAEANFGIQEKEKQSILSAQFSRCSKSHAPVIGR